MNILKNFIRIYFSLWQNCKNKINWKRQYSKCVHEKLVQATDYRFENLKIKKILILCPHADDEWIGCSTLINSNEYSVDVLYYELYGYNRNTENIIIRDNEIKKCSRIKKYNLYTSSNVKQKLKDLLLSSQYDAVFSPSPIDWHWEHREVFGSLVTVLNCIKGYIDVKIFFYFISVPPCDSFRLYTHSLNKKAQIEKWTFFNNNYVSQKMPNLRYMLQERLNALNTEFYAAEVFQEISIEQVFKIDEYIHNQSVKIMLDSLSKDINDIYKIRKICKTLEYER